MPGLKILFFYQYFGTPNGSWSTRVYELTRRWVKQGHEVTVVTAPYEKSDISADRLISEQNVEGIHLIVINSGDSNRLPKIRRASRALRFSFLASYFALKKDFDIAIASSGPITIGIPMLAARMLKRRKAIFEVRDLWPSGGIEMGLIKQSWQKNLGLWFERICYRNADHVITASVGQKKHINDRYPDLRISVIPNASDNDLFGRKVDSSLPQWAQSANLFTHIGSLGFIHNIEYWVKVARQLSKNEDAKDIILIFIGDGADRSELEKKVEKYSLNNIKFLGLKPKKELPLWVQNSVATLFATLDNPVQNTCSPNKIFDSFAAGVPIVQTSTGWIRDLVIKYECGVNVPLKDPRQGAKIIMELANNRHKRMQMGKNAKRLAETIFNRDDLADEYLKIIKEIVRK